MILSDQEVDLGVQSLCFLVQRLILLSQLLLAFLVCFEADNLLAEGLLLRVSLLLNLQKLYFISKSGHLVFIRLNLANQHVFLLRNDL